MKVRQEILEKINPAMRAEIAVELGTDAQNVYVAMKRNVDNGRMTKMDFLMAISKILKIEIEEILEEETAVHK